MYEFRLTMDWFCDEKLQDYDNHTAATQHFSLTADFTGDDEGIEKECAILTRRLFDCTKVNTDFWSFFDEEDADDAVYVELFGIDNGYSPEVEKILGFELSPSKIILFHELVVKRQHRGKGLGLKMLSDTADLFELTVDFCALIPVPLQFRERNNPDYVKEDFKAQDKETARNKLVSLYESVGFTPTDLPETIMIRHCS